MNSKMTGRILLLLLSAYLLIGCSAKGDTREMIEEIATESGYMVEERNGEYHLLKDNTEAVMENRRGKVILKAVIVNVVSKSKGDNTEGKAGVLQIIPVNSTEAEVYLDYDSLLKDGRVFPNKIFIVCDYDFEYIRNHRRDALAKFEKYYYNITNNWATKEELNAFYHEALKIVDKINDGISDN